MTDRFSLCSTFSLWSTLLVVHITSSLTLWLAWFCLVMRLFTSGLDNTRMCLDESRSEDWLSFSGITPPRSKHHDYEMWNRCVTSSLDLRFPLNDVWYGCRTTFDRTPLRGATCILLGPEIGFPRSAFHVSDVTTEQVAVRQAINWHPPVVVGKSGPIPASPDGNTSLTHRGM